MSAEVNSDAAMCAVALETGDQNKRWRPWVFPALVIASHAYRFKEQKWWQPHKRAATVFYTSGQKMHMSTFCFLFRQTSLMQDCSLVTFHYRKIQYALNSMGVHRGYENILLSRDLVVAGFNCITAHQSRHQTSHTINGLLGTTKSLLMSGDSFLCTVTDQCTVADSTGTIKKSDIPDSPENKWLYSASDQKRYAIFSDIHFWRHLQFCVTSARCIIVYKLQHSCHSWWKIREAKNRSEGIATISGLIFWLSSRYRYRPTKVQSMHAPNLHLLAM